VLLAVNAYALAPATAAITTGSDAGRVALAKMPEHVDLLCS